MDALGIDYEIDENVVRGLDYYNHTIFEVMTQSKALGHGWSTITGGGRYNGLVSEFGGPEMAGVGFGIGLERLMLLLESENAPLPEKNKLDIYVANQGQDTDITAMQMVQAIRSFGYSADRDYEDRKLKAQFKTANRLNARYMITIGERELADQSAHLKDMATGKETSVKLAELYTNLPEYIKSPEDEGE